MKKTLLSVSLVSVFTTLAGSAMALEQRPILTLEVAKKMAAACEAKASSIASTSAKRSAASWARMATFAAMLT